MLKIKCAMMRLVVIMVVSRGDASEAQRLEADPSLIISYEQRDGKSHEVHHF